MPEEIRMEMLRTMVKEDSRLEVTDVEFQHPKHWYAQETMDHIQQQYPEAELYFLIGSDNLENYARAFRLVEFLENYRYAVVDRGMAIWMPSCGKSRRPGRAGADSIMLPRRREF